MFFHNSDFDTGLNISFKMSSFVGNFECTLWIKMIDMGGNYFW